MASAITVTPVAAGSSRMTLNGSRKQREKPAVPLLLSSFPSPPSHIPPSPRLPLTPNTTSTPDRGSPSSAPSAYVTASSTTPPTGSPFSTAFGAAVGRPPSSVSFNDRRSPLPSPLPSPSPLSQSSSAPGGPTPRPSLESTGRSSHSYSRGSAPRPSLDSIGSGYGHARNAMPRPSMEPTISRGTQPRPSLEYTASGLAHPRLSMSSIHSVSSSSSQPRSPRSPVYKNPPPSLPPPVPLPALPVTPSPISEETLILFRNSVTGASSRRSSGGSLASFRGGHRFSGASFTSDASEIPNMPSLSPGSSNTTSGSGSGSIGAVRDSQYSTRSVNSLGIPAYGKGKGADIRTSILEEDDDDLAFIMARYQDDDLEYESRDSRRDSIADIDMRDLPPLTLDDLNLRRSEGHRPSDSLKSPTSASTLDPSSGTTATMYSSLTRAFMDSVTSISQATDDATSEAAYDATSPMDSIRFPSSPLPSSTPSPMPSPLPQTVDPYEIHLEMRAARSKSRTHKNRLKERSQSRHESRGGYSSASSVPASPIAKVTPALPESPNADRSRRSESPDISTILQRTPRPAKSTSGSSSRSASRGGDSHGSEKRSRKSAARRPGTSDTIRPGTSDTIRPSGRASPTLDTYVDDEDSILQQDGEHYTGNPAMPSSTASSSSNASSTQFTKYVAGRERFGDFLGSEDPRIVFRRDSDGTFGGPSPVDDNPPKSGAKRDSGSDRVGRAMLTVDDGPGSDDDGSFVSDYGVEIKPTLARRDGRHRYIGHTEGTNRNDRNDRVERA